MKNNINGTTLAYALIIGSLWGFGEVVLGVGLRSCAQMVSGSLMTGVALFFITAAWVVSSRNYLVPLLVVLVASCFKLFDAVLLSLPVKHGAIGNPIFAFWMEGLAFMALTGIFRRTSWSPAWQKALLGGGSALAAVSLFPLVKYATGIPACLQPGTAIPLSIYYGPVAVVFSALMVPAGFHAGNGFKAWLDRLDTRLSGSFLRIMASPATLLVCLALVMLFRLLVHTDF